RSAPNARRQKIGGLEQNIPGRLSNSGLLATHHATDSHGAFLIGDYAIVRFQRVWLSVECEKLFSIARESDVDVASQFVCVERVRRLSEFEHHEVRDVNDVVDRTNASALNFRAQPLRTRSDFHVVDPTRREKWTLTCRANRHAGFFDGNFGFAGRRLQFLAGERCDFAREAKMTEQIARSEEHTSELQSRGHLVCRL